MCKTELLPLTHQLLCCCIKFALFFITRAICSCVCPIILKIPKIPICVLNYTADTEDICPCVKLYRSYLRWYLVVCQIWNNYLLPKLSLTTNNISRTSTHSVSLWKYPSIITNVIYYYLQDLLPAMSRNIWIIYINHWQTHFNLKLSNGTLLWKKSNTILPVKKIVEEFYDTSKFKT